MYALSHHRFISSSFHRYSPLPSPRYNPRCARLTRGPVGAFLLFIDQQSPINVPLFHSIIHSFNHSLIQAFMHSLIHSFVNRSSFSSSSIIPPFQYSIIPFYHSIILSFYHSFIHSFLSLTPSRLILSKAIRLPEEYEQGSLLRCVKVFCHQR